MTGYHAKLRQLFFELPSTSRTRLGSPPNFAKTRFGRFPTFHFSTSKFFFEASNGRLPSEDGSDRPQTLGKRVSGDPRHFIFRRPQTFLATKFLSEKFFVNSPKFFSAKCLFWRSCAGLDVTGRCASKIHCPNYRFQPSTTLGGGGKKGKTVFVVSFGLKKLIPSSLL